MDVTNGLFFETKTFFLRKGRMGYQKIHNFILISKCTFDLSKMCTKKVLPKKPIFLGLSTGKTVFLAKKFFGCTFYKNHIYIFEISIKRRIL
jgi:hypothetical protein